MDSILKAFNNIILPLIAGVLLGTLVSAGLRQHYQARAALFPHGQSLSDTVNIQGNPVVIQQSRGGRVDQFDAEIAYIRSTGKQVILDGYCASACTMILSVPTLCATDRALLGFHKAWQPGPGPGGHIEAPQGTAMMKAKWRPYVFQWLRHVGGLTADIKWMGPQDIYRMVPRCG